MHTLSELIAANSAEIARRAAEKLGSRPGAAPADEALAEGIPLFLTQLVERLRCVTSDSAAIEEGAARHGAALQRTGVTVGRVVHDYGDVCQAVTELAEALGTQVSVHEFHTLNLCIDDAIAGAVSEFVRQRETAHANEGTERLGMLAHELRNRLAAATLSFAILRRGEVALNGSTGAVLGRSLRDLRDIVSRALAEARLESGVNERRRLSVFELLEEVEIETLMDACPRGIVLVVVPGSRDVDVDVDPQILRSVIGNLLQNAFKFTRARGHVSLRASATSDQVTIEVEDECGGLEPGTGDRLFRPFAQMANDRSGLGLGLAVSRRAVTASGGRLGVRDLPGKGCLFAIELPRATPF